MTAHPPGDLSFDALFRPAAGRDWFAGLPKPFGGDPGRFSRRDAAWLAEASLLAYLPDAEVKARALARAGAAEITFFDGGRTHAFAVAVGRGVAVVFRGTEPGDAEDLRTDLKFLMTPAERPGRVHEGFRGAYDRVRRDLEAWLGTRDAPVRFAGHSLGAALATLAASRRAGPSVLYTFGSPRVGDAAFRDALRAPAFRVVNNTDFVCRIPPAPYRHVGTRIFLSSDGRVRRDPRGIERFGEQVRGHLDHAADVVSRWAELEVDAIPWAALADHSPVRYADLLRAQVARRSRGG